MHLQLILVTSNDRLKSPTIRLFCSTITRSTKESIKAEHYWHRVMGINRVLGAVNSLRPRQNGRLFADDTFKRIFLDGNIRISTKTSLKFVPKDLINNIAALVLIMAWRQPGDKPLSEPMLVRSLTHICVTRPQWVKTDGLTLPMVNSYFLTHLSHSVTI